MQKGQFIAYASKKFKVHKKNYSSNYLDSVNVAFASKYGIIIDMAFMFDIFSYHNSVQYVFTQKDITVIRMRWLELLKGYEQLLLPK